MVTFLSILFTLLTPAFSADAHKTEQREVVVIETQNMRHTFTIDIANTPETLRAGLMHQTQLPENYGMLFDFGSLRRVSMWMKNTPLSLDMVFIDERGIITQIAHLTTPYAEDIIASRQAVRGVLEIAGGTAKRLGIAEGDKVEHALFSQEKHPADTP